MSRLSLGKRDSITPTRECLDVWISVEENPSQRGILLNPARSLLRFTGPTGVANDSFSLDLDIFVFTPTVPDRLQEDLRGDLAHFVDQHLDRGNTGPDDPAEFPVDGQARPAC
jgi:hypothetical protein